MRLFWRFLLMLVVALSWAAPAQAAVTSVRLINPGGRLHAPADPSIYFSASVSPAPRAVTSLEFWVDRGRPSGTRVCGATVPTGATNPVTRACRIDFARFGVGIHTAQAVAVRRDTRSRVWSNVVRWRKLRADPQPAPPWRGAFYYPWYPQTWSSGTHFTPKLGHYASGDPDVIDQHLDMLEHGRFEVGISSWWAQNHRTNANLGLLLARTAAELNAFRWTVYYECEGNNSSNSPACGPTKDPSVVRLANDLTHLWERYGHHPNYMRIANRMVVFVYSADDGPEGDDDPTAPCEVLRRWKQAQRRAAIDVHVVMKLFSGYKDCPNQPDDWHQYGPSSPVHFHTDAKGKPSSYVISPGFRRATASGAPEGEFLARNLPAWRQQVRGMIASTATWKLVTTFNEWGEGTAVEAARQWPSPSGHGYFLDVLRDPNWRPR
jgi:glycosyl hydrolase family 99